MINQRAFGVEIECGSPWSYDYDGYNRIGPVEKTIDLLERNDLKHWTHDVHYDGTQIEIPSPILRGSEGMRELMKTFALLKSNDFYVTREDGMHVHHDTSDLSFEQIQTIAETWYENQDLIYQLVSPFRRTSSWCSRLTREDLALVADEVKDNRHKTSRYGGSEHQKYKSLSLYNREYMGTIELRLHEGTLNFQRAKSWILFGQAFIHNTAQRKRPVKYATLEELLLKIRVRSTARGILLNRKGK